MVFGFTAVPTAFMPDEDQGSLMVQVTLPAGATQETTLPVIQRMQEYFMKN